MDITGKHIVITGATAGIGQSSAHTLAQQGADLTLLCRNLEKGAAVAADIIAAGGREPKLIEMDMASLASVRSAAQAVLAPGRPVDILLNNAGVVNTARKLTVDGFEETLAVNHFAPFLLTGLLLPNMLEVPGARIVNVASAAHEFVRNMGFDDMQAEQGFKTFREYGRSKLANILFTRSLATRLEGESITVNCLHPGAVATSLGAQNKGLVARLLPALLRPFFRTADKGAQTSIYLCTSDEVADVSGAYFANCKQKLPRPWARDDDAAQRLWEYTEETIGFEYP
ncbi:SDR family oxidoreductase [Pseudohalioglobus lutimaris]|uniref:KR domain-containing protein n=1 Tax=Pseudohalioglobus lutimaris TaxID=1737061 RepID=A0A2N5X441_9GAMM|nr:SDR family oxidoreductase [Pseudohalioglobus lutimaris]PLW69247.1 KR domain-containing protein [Pseudohalioglobus lutimaris]